MSINIKIFLLAILLTAGTLFKGTPVHVSSSIGNLDEDSSHRFGCWIDELPSYELDYKVSATQFLKGDYV